MFLQFVLWFLTANFRAVATQVPAYPQRQLRNRSSMAAITTVMSMSLMLFFLGLFASYLLLGQRYAQRVEEAVSLDIQLIDDANPSAMDQLARKLKNASFTRSVEFVDKQQALGEYQQKFGGEEDLTAPLGGLNPLPSSFRVKLLPDYIQADSLAKIRESLGEEVIVSVVEFPLDQMVKLRENLQVVSWLMLGIGLALLGIAFYLIFGTIRLGIYAQRLAIRSMQLIGATEGFIRRPFVIRGIVQGGISGITGCLLVLAAWGMLALWSPTPLPMWHLRSADFIGLLLGIVLIGLLLGWAGSYLAVNRYLNKDLDKLMQD